MLNTLSNVLSIILHWLLPSFCVACNKRVDNQSSLLFCQECYCDLPFNLNACRFCGQSISANTDYCGRCLNAPPNYQQCFCAFQYQAPIDDLIRQFKYQQHPELANQLAKLLYEELINYQIEMPDCLIPVPLHISKLRERGFNQSLLLAKALSRLCAAPCWRHSIIKYRATEPQVKQHWASRKRNIKGSFKLHKPPAVEHIAIIDDVVTSGATTREISRLLKRSGVKKIQVWALAHTA